MKIKRLGTWFVIGGLLLIAAALCLVGGNLLRDAKASVSAAEIMEELKSQTDFSATSATTEAPQAAGTNAELPPPETYAGETEIAEEPPPDMTEPGPDIPEHIRNPEMEMPAIEIDGRAYIGAVELPSLDLALPVMEAWSYPALDIAPCRYTGSAYLDDMIVMGHNYSGHFGKLTGLQLGDRVVFSDMAGNTFVYQVAEIETLGADRGEDLAAGEWDLTLLTCTVGGRSRLAVRCSRISGLVADQSDLGEDF